MIKGRKYGLRRILLPLVFWLGVWILMWLLVDQELLLASPWSVAKQLTMLGTAAFWQAVGTSLLRCLGAYLLGVLVGSAAAVLSSSGETAGMIIRPAMAVVRATPVTSFIILVLVWLDNSRAPVIAGALMVMPVVYASICQSMEAVDRDLLEMAAMYRWRPLKVWRYVRIPSAMPAFISACEACIGLCFKATIAAELIGLPRQAIGTGIYYTKVYLETDKLMAWTLIIVILSMLTEKLMQLLFERGRKHVPHP